MRPRILLGALAIVAIYFIPPAFGDDDDGKGRWWREQSNGEYSEGPCKVKIESKEGHRTKEIKCKDCVGASWRSGWKKEYEDGDCKVKIETSREEYKEDVDCD